MSIEARRLSVPFNVFKPAQVRVWLIPSTAVLDDVPFAVLVDFDSYLKALTPSQRVEALISEDKLPDRRLGIRDVRSEC